jgi:hypothetical protein
MISGQGRQENKLMWIFSSQGFLSIVRHIDKPNILIVRSRFQGHLEKMFPKALVLEDAERDYRYRAELPTKEVSKVIARLVSEIDYDNFKNSLDMNDEKYFESCVEVYNLVARNSDMITYGNSDWDLDNFI